VTNAINNSF